MSTRLWPCLLVCTLVLFGLGPAAAQNAGPRPFGLPFLTPPGPATWYFLQGYGNTLEAHNARHSAYSAGQGLHFGVDFAAPCGTPVAAIADGVVTKVDAPEHKALPHNLMIVHANGYASFYGHLLARAPVFIGQSVQRGQIVALSGDSFGTCHSAPHLHLEIRDAQYRYSFNPVTLIEADWDSLALTGRAGATFTRDLANPRRWQFLDDQPVIQMGGPVLNDYEQIWPPGWP